jgi:RimJ/RimL family protein N-acetyltransferase
MYNPYAVGRRVYLRHPTPQDVEGRWHQWFSDEETLLWLPLQYWPSSVERQREHYQAGLKSADRLLLSIVDKDSDRHIGVCSFAINWLHQFTEIALVIGEKEFRTGPHALDSLALMMQIAFLRLNMRIVRSSYVDGNDASKGLTDVLRFEETGRTRDLWWIRGRYCDGISIALYRDEWLKRNPDALTTS